MNKKGLSPVIGMIFVLLVLISIIIPLAYLVSSTQAKFNQAYAAVQPMFNLAEEQIKEINNPSSPLGFYYDNVTGKAYIVYYGSPSVPINISYFLAYTTNNIKAISNVKPITTIYNGYPAVEYDIGPSYNTIAMVTNVGNIIYANPIIQSSLDSPPYGDATGVYYLYTYNPPSSNGYTLYSSPYSVLGNFQPVNPLKYSNVSPYFTKGPAPHGALWNAIVVVPRHNEVGWVNFTVEAITVYAPLMTIHDFPLWDTPIIGMFAPTPTAQQRVYAVVAIFNNQILFNVSPDLANGPLLLGTLISAYLQGGGIIRSYGSLQIIYYILNIDYFFNYSQVYVYVYANGKPMTLNTIIPQSENWQQIANGWWQGNYNTYVFGGTPHYLQVPSQPSIAVPLGWIETSAGYTGPIWNPVQYPYDPIPVGVPITFIFGANMGLISVQTNL